MGLEAFGDPDRFVAWTAGSEGFIGGFFLPSRPLTALGAETVHEYRERDTLLNPTDIGRAVSGDRVSEGRLRSAASGGCGTIDMAGNDAEFGGLAGREAAAVEDETAILVGDRGGGGVS